MDDSAREKDEEASNRGAACSPPTSNHRSIPPEGVTEAADVVRDHSSDSELDEEDDEVVDTEAPTLQHKRIFQSEAEHQMRPPGEIVNALNFVNQ